MTRPLRVAAGSADIPFADLRDSLLLRLGALDLIRGCIVRFMENHQEWDILESSTYLLDLVISDSRQEIDSAFQEAGPGAIR